MRKLCWALLLLFCVTGVDQEEILYAGPPQSGLPSITQTLAEAKDGDIIVLADGVYDESSEQFPLLVDKAVTLRSAQNATPILIPPTQTTAMKITGQGASVSALRFDHVRCAIWVLADDVSVTDCSINLIDEAWRTSSCGLWIAGAKRTTLTGNSFTDCGIAMAGPPISDSSAGLPVLTAMFEVGEDIEMFTTHTVEKNLVNGKPLLYLIGEKDNVFSQDAGQIIAVQCQNVSFENIDVDFGSIGIQLAYCRDVYVKNCSANDNGIFGIYVMKTQGCSVTDTRADRCAHGIDVRDAERVLIADCITNACGQGTFFSWGRNCLVQNCEIVGNGTGFFAASGNDNHVDGCRIENNDLGLYIQHEPIFTLTQTQINNNSTCGMRVTNSGVISLYNRFTNNFVGHLALDCDPLTHMHCTFTGSEDCDMFIRNSRAIKLIGNSFDKTLGESVEFVEAEAPLQSK